MYMSRFGVKRYKCLGEIDIPLTPIHVLIGQNDSGKTSLLEAMAALYASAEKPLPEVFPKPWSGRELVLHGSQASSIELSGNWDVGGNEGSRDGRSWFRYGFMIDFPAEGRTCRVQNEKVRDAGSDRFVAPESPGHQSTALQRRRSDSNFAKRVTDDVFSVMDGVLRPAGKYSLDARVMGLPAAIDPKRKFRLDADGFGLPTLLDDILGFDPEMFLELRRRFCEYFPQFRSVRIESEVGLRRESITSGPGRADTSMGKGIYFETHTGQTIRAQQASDGAILFLGFLALAYVPEPPTLLLIEEPENGIYPKRLGEVIKLLKALVERTEGVRFPQIIMSTHSPYVLSFFEPEEATFLSRDPSALGAPVRARPLRDAPHIKDRLGNGEFYLGELWYNLSEEELFRGV